MWEAAANGDAGHKQAPGKVFVGGLSWETTDAKLRTYFENYGAVQEAFVSYDRATGRPRGFGFVVFDDPAVADKVTSIQHTIDRREVEAKKAVPKLDQPAKPAGVATSTRTKKIFVGGLAPSVDEKALRAYFELMGEVEDAVVLYDHDNKRPRGFGFITFTTEAAVEQVFMQGAIQSLHDKPIEIKRAVPREQMTAAAAVKTPRAPVTPVNRSPFAADAPSFKPPSAGPGSPVGGVSGVSSLYSSLMGMARHSFDSPTSGGSGGSGSGSLGIPAVRTSADLLPYPTYLEQQGRHSLDMGMDARQGMERMSTHSLPSHSHSLQQQQAAEFSLFSNNGLADRLAERMQLQPLQRRSVDSQMALEHPSLFSAPLDAQHWLKQEHQQQQAAHLTHQMPNPWAKPASLAPSHQPLYALPELERLYLSAGPSAAGLAGPLGPHQMGADFLAISACQS